MTHVQAMCNILILPLAIALPRARPATDGSLMRQNIVREPQKLYGQPIYINVYCLSIQVGGYPDGRIPES